MSIVLQYGPAKRVSASVALLLLVAACAGEMGGSGRLSTGEPLSGTLTPDVSNGRTIVTVASPAGWSCKSVMDETSGKGAAKTLPMTCTDGASGTMILTMNNIQKQVTGSFQLNNGKTGQVDFGFNPA